MIEYVPQICFFLKKGVGINPKFARTIGISVDHRRKNRSEESLQSNIARLKEFRSRLIILPKKSKNNNKRKTIKVKDTKDKDAMDVDKKPKPPTNESILSSAGELVKAGPIIPIVQQKDTEVTRDISISGSKESEEKKKMTAFCILREARAAAKFVGYRKKLAEKNKAGVN